jgi:hypothetical protein
MTVAAARDIKKLDPADRARFRTGAIKLAKDLNRGQVRAGLRVKPVQGAHPPKWEMTWAPDGRATFRYGAEVKPGQAHIIWLRVGKHNVIP